jgi:uncharacterized tellurite resistance protein B-like protein
MFGNLKALFSGGGTDDSKPPAEKLQMAAAVLLVHAACMDGEFTEDEKSSVDHILRRHFDLSPEASGELVGLAETRQDEASDLNRYTLTIKDQFSDDERVELVELLWEVVYADGELHAYEANLLRRIAGLLYVSDRDRGEARKRVLRRLGVQEE